MFWDMNITKLRPYLLAEEIKWQNKNSEFHLLGRYFFDAVSIAVSNALGGKRQNYPDKPYDFGTSDERLQHKRQLAKEERMKAQFVAFAEATEKRLENVRD